MLTLTETAGARLVEKLDKKGAADDSAIRLVRKRRGWRLRVDRPATGDALFAHDGRTVLMLDADASQRLTDRTLDTRDSDSGQKLWLRR